MSTKRIFAILEVDEDVLMEETEETGETFGERFEREMGWAAQSGITMSEWKFTADELKVRLPNGYLTATAAPDPDYPGIDVEFIADDDEGEMLSRPRVLIEKPAGEKLRALIWNDPRNEDYTEEIFLEPEGENTDHCLTGFIITRPRDRDPQNGFEIYPNGDGTVKVFTTMVEAKEFLAVVVGASESDIKFYGIDIREYNDNEVEVKTNMGIMPIVDYREIVAGQAGYSSYADFYKAGLRIGRGYDRAPKEA